MRNDFNKYSMIKSLCYKNSTRIYKIGHVNESRDEFLEGIIASRFFVFKGVPNTVCFTFKYTTLRKSYPQRDT